MNVQSLSRPQAGMSIDEFFDWIETKAKKYELVDGKPKSQPWVKRNHNRIVVNIVGLLDGALDTRKFEIATGDFAIVTGFNSLRYADVMVEIAGGPGNERIATDAVLLVEVLSDSTAHVDFGKKLAEYQGLRSSDTYLIVAQDKRSVWQWTRDINGEWPDGPTIMELGEIRLETLGISLAIDDIYRNVDTSGLPPPN